MGMGRYFALLLLVVSQAQAFEFGTNLFVKGTQTNASFGTDLTARGQVYLLVGSSVAFGPVLTYERMHSYMTDIVYGGTVRFGSKWLFELGGGVLQRKYQTFFGTSNERGFAVIPAVGFRVSKRVRISFAYPIKKITSGGPSRLHGELLPYFGLNWGNR